MKFETSLNHRARAVSLIESMVYGAKVSSVSSEQFTKDSIEILASISHCPRWVQEYCRGFLECERKHLCNSNLVFGGYLEGIFYSTRSSREDYYQKHGIVPSQWAEKVSLGEVTCIGHYWSHSLKPWFTG